MEKRKEWTLFYCTAEIDKALRECDEERAKKRVIIEPGVHLAIDGKYYYNEMRIIAE